MQVDQAYTNPQQLAEKSAPWGHFSFQPPAAFVGIQTVQDYERDCPKSVIHQLPSEPQQPSSWPQSSYQPCSPQVPITCHELLPCLGSDNLFHSPLSIISSHGDQEEVPDRCDDDYGTDSPPPLCHY